jgi:hypothetical protein
MQAVIAHHTPFLSQAKQQLRLDPAGGFFADTVLFSHLQTFLIITITHVRKPFGCDPVVVEKVAVIIFSSSSATNTSKS